MYDNQHISIMSIAAILAAVVLGAAGNVSGRRDAGRDDGIAGPGRSAPINFTRSNESEADRVGMDVLSSAGFDPNGMASFFDEIQKRYGGSKQ